MLPGCAGSLSSGCVGPAGLLCQSAWLWCRIQILMHFCIVMHFCIIDVSIWFGSLCSVNLLLNPCSGFCPIRKSRYGLWIVNSCVDMHQEVVSQNGIGQCVNDIEAVMHECMASGQFWFDTSDWQSISFCHGMSFLRMGEALRTWVFRENRYAFEIFPETLAKKSMPESAKRLRKFHKMEEWDCYP